MQNKVSPPDRHVPGRGTLSLDLGYAHLFVKDATIRKTATGEDRLRGALSGSYRSQVDIVSAEIVWRFD